MTNLILVCLLFTGAMIILLAVLAINHFLRTPDETDEVMQMVVERTMATGNVVVANRREDGTIEIEEIKNSYKPTYRLDHKIYSSPSGILIGPFTDGIVRQDKDT